MIANIAVEIFWNTIQAVFIFVCWYFPIGLYNNTAKDGALVEREGLMFLLIWAFLMFTSTFAHMVIAGIELAETGGNIANLLFSLCLVFCGVLVGPSALPGFWIFMYRISPFTYLVSSMLSVGVANTNVVCADYELMRMDPPNSQTCGEYLGPYIRAAGGYIDEPNATSNCGLCPIDDTNVFLASVSSYYSERWRNFGIMWAYVIFNIVAAVFIYWWARVPKNKKTKGLNNQTGKSKAESVKRVASSGEKAQSLKSVKAGYEKADIKAAEAKPVEEKPTVTKETDIGAAERGEASPKVGESKEVGSEKI